MSMKVKTILVSQPEPKVENSPYFELQEKELAELIDRDTGLLDKKYSYPITEYAYQHGLSLPSSYLLSEDEQEIVINEFNKNI